jgi:hypothetical protein
MKRVKSSAKNFAKWIVVGAITVGAIKMADSKEDKRG